MNDDAPTMRAELTVAIVDDDHLVRASMGNLIRSLGYAVELFSSGPTFLCEDLARFACLISDMQMPEMSGLVLQAKVQESAPELPVIFLSAFPDEWARSRALAAGACGFFAKPCDLDELVAALETAAGPTSRDG